MAMFEVDNGEIDDAYQKFCTEFKLNDESINSVTEFLCFTGTGFNSVIRSKEFTKELSYDAYNKIKLANGEHATVVLKAYWVRRRSLHGKLRLWVLKPVYTVAILLGFARLLYFEIKALI